MSKDKIFLLALVMLFTLGGLEADAQCAMCKAVAESNNQGSSSIVGGLNIGIVYLMFFPYLIMAGVAYALYRLKKKKSAQ